LKMETWKKLLKRSVVDAKGLARSLNVDEREAARVAAQYPLRINPYLLRLVESRGGPIGRQCVPDIRELKEGGGQADPLKEESYSPLPGLVHRYPDRALLYVSNVCASYCRFCTRKRKVGFRYVTLRESDLKPAMRYIRERKGIRDVIISGGDPLMLSDRKLERYLKQLRRISHVEIIRIDSRAPSSLPQRITPKLCNMLRRYAPLYLLAHFNHPREITREAKEACRMLAEAGVALGNQSVLLRGVNDSARTLRRLGEELLKIRVRPYYLYVPDAVLGTHHFRVPIRKALKIIRLLIGHTSGLAVPHLIIDLENGGGKLPLLPKYVVRKQGRKYTFRNFEGRQFLYHDL